jgi:nucleotide-binding universal stress UspA family protein
MKIVLRRILVPTDFSDRSRIALSYGVALVEEFGASLHLLHVIDGLAADDPVALPVQARAEIQRDAEAAAWIQLRQVLGNGGPSRIRKVLAVESGDPAAEILRYARTHAIDLIVGNVDESVVHYAPCPVLALRHPEREFVRP